ncbi:MAG TPA: PhzF family phenazine biosynthesis protein [Vicinamibacteria bacterium]
MKLPYYHVDAFTNRVFSGNPAGVVPLSAWLDDATLQAIAAENNVTETAFFVGEQGSYAIRWFTPTTEVDLCGHATLASGFVLSLLHPGVLAAEFKSRSGPLRVSRDGDLFALDFPTRNPRQVDLSGALQAALGARPKEVWAARDLMAVYETEEEVRGLKPDLPLLSAYDTFAVLATAPGREADFVSRFFAPRQGIPEDPVTGSAHCTLVPYWARRLGKPKLHALQVSARGGELFCEDRGDRVSIAGRAVLYFEGTIEV